MKLGYIAMRLVKTVLITVAVVLLSFFLIRMVPGDAATVMAGQAGYADECQNGEFVAVGFIRGRKS